MERSFNLVLEKKGVGYNLLKIDLKNAQKHHLPLLLGKIIFLHNIAEKILIFFIIIIII
jgi:hypothetical protein